MEQRLVSTIRDPVFLLFIIPVCSCSVKNIVLRLPINFRGEGKTSRIVKILFIVQESYCVKMKFSL